MTARWLTFLYLLIISDTIASLMLSITFWKLRNGRTNSLVVWLTGLFFVLFLQGMLEMAAVTFGYEIKPTFTIGFTWCYWVGRGLKTTGMWAMVYFLIGHKQEAYIVKKQARIAPLRRDWHQAGPSKGPRRAAP